MNSTAPKLYDLLYLLTIPNIGPGRIRRLLQVFNNKEEILKAPVQKIVQVEGFDLKLASQIKNGGDQKTAENQLELIEKLEVKYITIWDKNYPELLKRISDPPAVLFYYGNFPDNNQKTISVVGTRTPSHYGKIVTEEIVRELVNHGYVIISGMARGIDTIAHSTAIKNSGGTQAVLGCGIEYCYPPENKKLYQDIIQQGAVISEFFIGTGPDAPNFPKRNRIISGLSLGTLVVEAGDHSGALISALFALNQNREVFAVPGNINSPKSKGTNHLIKQGAKLIQSVDDILEELGDKISSLPKQSKQIPSNLPILDKKILDGLSHEPKHIDQLVLELKESPSTILASLLTLELMGLVQQLAGKMFIRI
jgi:DNA processing protein